MKQCEICGSTKGYIYGSSNKFGMCLCDKHYKQMLRHGEITKDIIKTDRQCSVCGTTDGFIYSSSNKHGIELCNKHYCQMSYCGKTLDRSMFEPNEIIINGDTMEVILVNRNHIEVGRAIVNSRHYDTIIKYKWFMNCNGYARGNKNGEQIFMHRLITGVTDEMVVDHKDGRRLNNLDSNLRICTHQENAYNHSTYASNSSGYTGVRFNNKSGKWEARIQVNKKYIHLGTFENIEDAIIARKQAELRYFGDFAYKEAK